MDYITANTKISIIVPIYKVEKYIERCARSLFEQTLDDIEFIFISDCSPDNSVSIVKKIIQQYPQRLSQVRFLSNDSNKGLAYTRQRGVDAARGEYIAHCDSDDWVEPEMYELLLNEANRTDADIVCCNYVEEYSHFHLNVKYTYLEEDFKIIQQSFPNRLNSAVWNKIIRKKLYVSHHIRWFEGVNMQEDLGVTLRLRSLSKKTVIVPYLLYHYNLQNTEAMTHAPRLDYVNEQILCAKLLTNWFDNNKKNEYAYLLERIRFWSKVPLIIHYSIFDSKKWKLIFPETNNLTWRLSKGMSFYNRVAIWLVSYNLDKYARSFIRLVSYMRLFNKYLK